MGRIYLTGIILTIVLFSSQVVALGQAARTTERQDFEVARKTKTVKALAEFIKMHPKSTLVPEAVKTIWEIMIKKYPSDEYSCSTNLAMLKVKLPEAIKNRQSYLIGFVPAEVEFKKRTNRW